MTVAVNVLITAMATTILYAVNISLDSALMINAA